MTRYLWRLLDEQCEGAHCVDLGESFQTHIYLPNLASIQPRTSPLNLPELLDGRVPLRGPEDRHRGDLQPERPRELAGLPYSLMKPMISTYVSTTAASAGLCD